MAASKEYLKRIDEKNYLTEREHREYLKAIEKDLDKLEQIKVIYNVWLEGKTSDFEIMKKIFEVLDSETILNTN